MTYKALRTIYSRNCGKENIMKFRRFASAALAAATLFSSVSVVAYADETAQEEMKQELTYVKERISIPERLSQFRYNSSQSYGKNKYSFTWQTPDNSSLYETVEVSITGRVITRYSTYNSFDYKEKMAFAELSREELIKKAKEWINTVNPTVSKYIELDEDSLNISISNQRAKFNIYRVKNGVRVNGQSGTISIDKDTGELISYNLNWIMGATFVDPKKAISVEKAEEAFQREFPVELKYMTSYDYETNEYTPYLVYVQNGVGEIDALTGQRSTFQGSYFSYDDDNAVVEEAADAENPATGGPVSFTPEEIEKMEKEGELITAEEAIKSLMDMGIFSMGDNPEVKSSYCNFDDRYGAYIREVIFTSNDKSYYEIAEPEPLYPIEEPAYPYEEFVEAEVEEMPVTNGTIRINAETGEILYFYSYPTYYNEEKSVLSVDKSQEQMKKYFKELTGERADEFRFDEARYSYSEYDKNGSPKKGAYITDVNISSPRYIYDIPSSAENADMSLARDGKIDSYCIRYYGIEYPKPDNIISADEAYDRYFEQVEHGLSYRIAIKEKKTLTALVYDTDRMLNIDAFSGELVNYNGRPIIKEASGYADLDGSKYREVAEFLESYNIVLRDEDGRLNEDEYITREDFSSLTFSIGCWYYNENNGDKALSRQFAAKILTNSVISEECAEIPGIFKSPYTDVKDTNKYVGYIAVATGLGYMSGEDGKFYPNKKVTRGEALQLIYDYLNK